MDAKNKKSRLEFVKQWANYVRTHEDTDWSAQQKTLIDSQFPSRMTKEQYLKMKGIKIKSSS